MHRVWLLLLCVGWVIPTLGAVDSVTIFPDRASVIRVIDKRVEAGPGELVLTDLPAGLARDTLRISASGPDGLRLGAYQLDVVRGSERTSERAREIERELQRLSDERAVIDDDLEARGLQLNLLRSLAGQAGQGDAPMAVDGWEDALQIVGRGAGQVLTERRELQLQRRELSREIERLEKQLADLGQRQQDALALTVAYESEQAGAAEFTIEYTVGGASWRPVYEWRLDTAADRLEIVQLAEVRQRTGEDWSQARLELSLSRPAAGGRLPEIMPWWIDVRSPEPDKSMDRAQVTGSRALHQEMLAAAPPVVEAQWQGAELVGNTYTQAYRVPGQASVASDNQPHRFRLDQHSVEVELSARAVPRYQPTAWLYARTTWEGELALPPGSVTLYQDDTLVGQTHFSGVAPGSELASSFGVDDRISIDYDLVRDDRAGEGLLRKSTVLTRVHRIQVRNGHSRPIALTLFDAMPVARDERITVTLIDASTRPDRRDVDDRPGVLAWDRQIAQGGSLELTVGYRLSFPEDLPGIEGW